MNDTITITAEEREMWASIATARINAVMPERQCEITAQERLMKALKDLEQAEANVARLTKERNYLANALAGYGDEDEDMSSADWKEAARRAVADSEVE